MVQDFLFPAPSLWFPSHMLPLVCWLGFCTIFVIKVPRFIPRQKVGQLSAKGFLF